MPRKGDEGLVLGKRECMLHFYSLFCSPFMFRAPYFRGPELGEEAPGVPVVVEDGV